MKIRIEIEEAEQIPNGYGLAWRDFPRRVTICYPIPLNLILNLLRRLWHWSLLSFRMEHSAIDKAFQEGRQAGIKDLEASAKKLQQEAYNRGADDGMKEVYRRIEDELND